jgi:hypothetical protein
VFGVLSGVFSAPELESASEISLEALLIWLIAFCFNFALSNAARQWKAPAARNSPATYAAGCVPRRRTAHSPTPRRRLSIAALDLPTQEFLAQIPVFIISVKSKIKRRGKNQAKIRDFQTHDSLMILQIYWYQSFISTS